MIHQSLLPLTISTLAVDVVNNLRAHGHTLALAESCTGGMLSMALTDVSGSSAVFTHGFITYANAAKTQCLGVTEALLAQHGAVSEPVARAMADGAKRVSGATHTLAITGIAGPDGGTIDKPVGTVFIALATPSQTLVKHYTFSGNRLLVRLESIKAALSLLLSP